ncbi:MAG: two-component regulator propeller domain-containing protein, partial [Acidobacteriota bacterium]
MSVAAPLLWGLFATAWAQELPRELTFRNLTVDDGLSQSHVTAIVQDPTGYLWFGTSDGLNRFDGLEFEIFRDRRGSDEGLQSNYINDLMVDTSGRLWIATRQGVDTFDAVQHRIVGLADLATGGDPAPRAEGINALAEDSLGNVWIGSASPSLFRYEKSSGLLFAVELSEERGYGCAGEIEALAVNEGGLWLGTDDGLCRTADLGRSFETFKPGTEPAEPPGGPAAIAGLPAAGINAMTTDGENVLWIGTDGQGVVRADFAAGAPSWRSYRHASSDPL